MSDEPISAQTGPYQVEVQEGKAYFFCTCGRSQKQPFCDGAHQSTSLQPLRFVAETTGTVNLCGCKQTDDAPFCDGSHNLL
ncbi:MAG: CDGSH iron-sulfur domain-containing protein [Hyphomicrobiaceae bacterium]